MQMMVIQANQNQDKILTTLRTARHVHTCLYVYYCSVSALYSHNHRHQGGFDTQNSPTISPQGGAGREEEEEEEATEGVEDQSDPRKRK
jgi:hypothetical protein